MGGIWTGLHRQSNRSSAHVNKDLRFIPAIHHQHTGTAHQPVALPFCALPASIPFPVPYKKKCNPCTWTSHPAVNKSNGYTSTTSMPCLRESWSSLTDARSKYPTNPADPRENLLPNADAWARPPRPSTTHSITVHIPYAMLATPPTKILVVCMWNSCTQILSPAMKIANSYRSLHSRGTWRGTA